MLKDSAMLTSLLQAVGRCFCQHEWMARSKSTRMYVECVKCLATSDGIDIRRGSSSVCVLTASADTRALPGGQLAA